MGSARTVAVLVVVVTLLVPVGIVVADEASIKSVSVVDTIDNDGDGAVSSFNIEIVADTKCFGCNDESDDDPDIEPRFTVTLIGEEGNDIELDTTETLPNRDPYTYVYQIPDDSVQSFDAQSLEVRVVFTDHDPWASDKIDEQSIQVAYEPPSADQATATATPTSTPTPTDTPTPTATPTPTPTPTPTAENDNTETQVRDSDNDGVIDSHDYAPNDPQVQEKADVSSTPVPGFGPIVVLAALGAFGSLLLIKRWR